MKNKGIQEFNPKNPEKYVGTLPIISRSSWELFFMEKMDRNPNVLKWASESLAISYISPKDNKKHKYYPDFVAEFKTPEGGIAKQVIELKPMQQCLPGTHKDPKKRAYQNMVYLVNQAKWEATKVLCEQNGFDFRVYTEQELFGK
jgi:hypothetical protein